MVGGSTDSGRVGGETGDVLGGEDDLEIGVRVGEVLVDDGDAKGFSSNYNGMTINKPVRISYKENREGNRRSTINTNILVEFTEL